MGGQSSFDNWHTICAKSKTHLAIKEHIQETLLNANLDRRTFETDTFYKFLLVDSFPEVPV